MDFKDIEWGEDEAKGDIRLHEYFVELPVMNDILSGKIRYVIGRKGTGKTAIGEKIRIDVSNNPQWFESSLSLKDFPLNTFRQLEVKQFKDKTKYVPTWTFLIAVELSKLLLNDNSMTDIEKKELYNFIHNNFPESAIGFTETIIQLEKTHLKVTPYGIGGEKEHSIEYNQPIHYQKATNNILNIIKNLKTECTFFLIFDELDEGYKAKDKSMNLILLALLRAIENVFIELKNSNIKFRPLLLLRSDIFDTLEDNDLNKLDDYIFKLNWSTTSGSSYTILDIINTRIKASTNQNLQWEDIADDYEEKRPRYVSSLLNYMLARTFERPRDIIKYLKYCKKAAPSGKLTFTTVEKAEFDYSNWFFKELRDEIHSHLPCWREAFMDINKIGKGKFSIKQYTEQLKKDKEIKTCDGISYEKIIETFFMFSALGNINKETGKWIFRYKDDDLPFNNNLDLVVHFGFQKKLRISPNYIDNTFGETLSDYW
ncbi:P-loop ATPase, Sll1717 family [Bilophila wadsworthia]|uniref:P-loop ATPase, Sll1717 family n=1 Tax=Bilophila wadsworthia TaxID=35833 RepID=UPI00242EECA5|nr:hypothetical protein [Bilophila wadsworthia]